jgi:hypothetical protein
MAREARYELMYKNERGFWVHCGTYVCKKHALAAVPGLGHVIAWRIVKWVRESGVVAQGGK